MNKCICCSDRLIKHLTRHRMYWFCPSCHQEMPSCDRIKANSYKNHSRKLVYSINDRNNS